MITPVVLQQFHNKEGVVHVARHVPIDRLGLQHVVSLSQTVSCQGCANKHRGHSSDIVPSPTQHVADRIYKKHTRISFTNKYLYFLD